jgi:hypothetical protein
MLTCAKCSLQPHLRFRHSCWLDLPQTSHYRLERELSRSTYEKMAHARYVYRKIN